jgi:uncharacterized OsmC-like protein
LWKANSSVTRNARSTAPFSGALAGSDWRTAEQYFLDEIGDLSLDLQTKLLRVLHEGDFEAVGSSQTRKVDVRVIAAANKDLHSEIHAGRFREDVVNGVNREQLFGTVDRIKETPGLGKFRFKIHNEWLNGAHTWSTVHSFFGAGADLEHAVQFELDADEPAILFGSDQAVNPGEYLLHALAACVTSFMVYHAAARGIAIEEIESSVEGDVDLRGFLGIDKNVRNGYQEIRMKFRIKADVPDEQLQELCMIGPQYSPTLDSITKGLPVKVAAERMA